MDLFLIQTFGTLLQAVREFGVKGKFHNVIGNMIE
jgi:hypothetical protein